VRGPIERAGGYETWQVALAALAVLLFAGLLTWLYLRSRRQPPAPIDPQAAALAELEAATQAVDDERFALLCSGAVRRFLASRFGMPATSQTSTELCSRLPLAAEDTLRIGGLLESCDAVKFARQNLSPQQRIQVLDTAKQLIETLAAQEDSAT